MESPCFNTVYLSAKGGLPIRNEDYWGRVPTGFYFYLESIQNKLVVFYRKIVLPLLFLNPVDEKINSYLKFEVTWNMHFY